MTRHCGVAVPRCRHDKVCEWIEDAVLASSKEMSNGNVDRLSIIVLSDAQIALERFVFDMSDFPLASPGSDNLEINRPRTLLSDLEQQYRAFLLRFSTIKSDLGSMPEVCTITMVVEAKPNGPSAPTNIDNWVAQDYNPSPPRTTTRPLVKIAAGAVRVETWVEESIAKGKMAESS